MIGSLDPSILDEIAANPTDAAPQLVVADALLEAGDPRGELIALDHHERSGAVLDPLTLERLLTLAGIYGFPDPTDTPPASLPWEVHSTDPVDCEVVHDGAHYQLETDEHHMELVVRDSEGVPQEEVRYSDGGGPAPASAGDLAAILGSIGDAILARTPLATLWFPFECTGAPVHAGGARRCYDLPNEFYRLLDAPRGLFGLAARDYHRWFGLWGRLLPHVPRDRYPGWPGRRLPIFERRLALARIVILGRVAAAPDDRLPSPAALYDAFIARHSREHGHSTLLPPAEHQTDRLWDEALEAALRTLGPITTVLAVGTETQLAPDAPWLELAPAPGWLPRLMSTEPGHVLLLSADGTRALLVRTSRHGTHETLASSTAELLGR